MRRRSHYRHGPHDKRAETYKPADGGGNGFIKNNVPRENCNGLVDCVWGLNRLNLYDDYIGTCEEAVVVPGPFKSLATLSRDYVEVYQMPRPTGYVALTEMHIG